MNTIFKKQIPTILALLLLFLGAGAGVFLVGRRVDFLPRAGPEHQPRNLRLTNITDESFTASWITDAPTIGFIKYGTNPASLENTIADDRDQLSGQNGNFTLHHVKIRGLTPSNAYFFQIGSGPSQELFSNGPEPFQVTTAPSLPPSDLAETAFGTIVTSGQTPAQDSIVYLTLEGASPLSTLVKSSGSWAISLAQARDNTLSSYAAYDPQSTLIDIEVIGPDLQSTVGTTTTGNDQPVPTITLGKPFNFAQTDLPELQSPPATASSTLESQIKTSDTGFSLDSIGDEPLPLAGSDLELHNPSIDGEQLHTQRPEFVGSAPPNTTITIVVESPTSYQDSLTTGQLGDFTWTPPADLEPGEHTITISYFDDNGILQELRRSFTVFAQEETSLPALTSSPSASPTPSSTQSGTPRISQPSTDSGIPVAGVATNTLFILGTGMGLLTAGLYISKKIKLT